MTRRIEIEGDLIRTIEYDVLHQGNLQDVLPLIENRPPVTLLHPRSAIYTHWDESNPNEKHVRFLCELEPAIRMLRKSNRGYRVAVPWTYFVFSFYTSDANPTTTHNWSMADHSVFHAPRRLESLEDMLYVAFLPNVDERGSICFGTTGVRTDQPLQNRIDQLVNEWYLTMFNNDLVAGRSHPFPFNGTGLGPWVAATREHGLQAYTMFPEWNMTNVPKRPAHEFLDLAEPRSAMVTLTDTIPPMATSPTFGRTEEWLRELTPTQRYRILVSMNNIIAEDPNAVAAQTTTLQTTTTHTETDDEFGIDLAEVE